MRACRFPLLLALPLAVLCLAAACSRPPVDEAGRKGTVAALYADARKEFPDAPEITAAAAVALWRQGGLLPIDVRTPAELAVSTLPGAVTGEAYLADPGLAAGKRAVVYCTIGYRSGFQAEALAKRGLPVANLAGGILGWLHAGGTLVDAKGQPTTRVHVYGRAWDLAPPGYTGVW